MMPHDWSNEPSEPSDAPSTGEWVVIGAIVLIAAAAFVFHVVFDA